MNPAVDQLAISILKKPLNECSADELRQLAQQYPWFAPAQLLFAKKIQSGNPALYEEQVQKTILYFQNRLWLHHLLNDNGSAEVIPPAKPAEAEKVQAEFIEAFTQGSFLSTEAPEPVTNPAEEEKASFDEADKPVPDALPKHAVPAADLAEMISVPVEQAEIIQEDSLEETVLKQEAEPVLEIPRLKIEPLKSVNTPFAFEPYHTVDYFASQGIKFKEDDRPKDQFGQQLKSFTEWLKILKRVPASEIGASVNDPGGEKKVVQLAEHSLAERHVITEAMAEVWIKQGNRARAEEIYRKLSLLDPLKTAYFAAKIEDLKKTS